MYYINDTNSDLSSEIKFDYKQVHWQCVYASSFIFFYLSRDWCTHERSAKRQPLITKSKGFGRMRMWFLSIILQIKSIVFIYIVRKTEK